MKNLNDKSQLSLFYVDKYLSDLGMKKDFLEKKEKNNIK